MHSSQSYTLNPSQPSNLSAWDKKTAIYGSAWTLPCELGPRPPKPYGLGLLPPETVRTSPRHRPGPSASSLWAENKPLNSHESITVYYRSALRGYVVD